MCLVAHWGLVRDRASRDGYEGLILPIARLPAPPKTPSTASGADTSTTLSMAGPLPPLGPFSREDFRRQPLSRGEDSNFLARLRHCFVDALQVLKRGELDDHLSAVDAHVYSHLGVEAVSQEFLQLQDAGWTEPRGWL
jgi:hypothetical protein